MYRHPNILNVTTIQRFLGDALGSVCPTAQDSRASPALHTPPPTCPDEFKRPFQIVGQVQSQWDLPNYGEKYCGVRFAHFAPDSGDLGVVVYRGWPGIDGYPRTFYSQFYPENQHGVEEPYWVEASSEVPLRAPVHSALRIHFALYHLCLPVSLCMWLPPLYRTRHPTPAMPTAAADTRAQAEILWFRGVDPQGAPKYVINSTISCIAGGYQTIAAVGLFQGQGSRGLQGITIDDTQPPKNY